MTGVLQRIGRMGSFLSGKGFWDESKDDQKQEIENLSLCVPCSLIARFRKIIFEKREYDKKKIIFKKRKDDRKLKNLALCISCSLIARPREENHHIFNGGCNLMIESVFNVLKFPEPETTM